ncbi:MAG: hypothetical protein R2825_03730 [Saprospiraceae bacterium]
MKNPNGQSFEQFEKELSPYLKTLQKAAEVIQTQGVSIFPIFVIHQHTVDIGINIVDRETVNWSVNASTSKNLLPNKSFP